MAAHFTIKQGDTSPALSVQFKWDDSVVDLTDATVKMYMGLYDESSLLIDGATCTITDAENGEIEYAWQTGDTDVVGLYEVEFVVTFSDGTIQTFPNDQFLLIEIVEDK